MRKNHGDTGSAPSIYAQVGGLDTLRRLVNAFYRRVERDPVLRGMFPQGSTRRRERLALFLAQVFGGPRRLHPQNTGSPGSFAAMRPFRSDRMRSKPGWGTWKPPWQKSAFPPSLVTPCGSTSRPSRPPWPTRCWPFGTFVRRNYSEQLQQDPDLVHRQDGSGSSLLHAAAGLWDLDRVTLLLAHGAAVDVGRSPLCNVANHYVAPAERSAARGQQVAELLLRHGAKVNTAVGPEAQTPLHMAARRGNMAVARRCSKAVQSWRRVIPKGRRRCAAP